MTLPDFYEGPWALHPNSEGAFNIFAVGNRYVGTFVPGSRNKHRQEMAGNGAIIEVAPDAIHALAEVDAEIRRINEAAGETIFNPTATAAVREVLARLCEAAGETQRTLTGDGR